MYQLFEWIVKNAATLIIGLPSCLLSCYWWRKRNVANILEKSKREEYIGKISAFLVDLCNSYLLQNFSTEEEKIKERNLLFATAKRLSMLDGDCEIYFSKTKKKKIQEKVFSVMKAFISERQKIILARSRTSYKNKKKLFYWASVQTPEGSTPDLPFFFGKGCNENLEGFSSQEQEAVLRYYYEYIDEYILKEWSLNRQKRCTRTTLRQSAYFTEKEKFQDYLDNLKKQHHVEITSSNLEENLTGDVKDMEKLPALGQLENVEKIYDHIHKYVTLGG